MIESKEVDKIRSLDWVEQAEKTGGNTVVTPVNREEVDRKEVKEEIAEVLGKEVSLENWPESALFPRSYKIIEKV